GAAEVEEPSTVVGESFVTYCHLTAIVVGPRENPSKTSTESNDVDVRGDALRSVVITRLPFDPPDRPLTEARLERIRERGGDPFREESIPRAVIKFKQGVGRLIRSGEDRGRIVVLDPRVLTKPYGRAFLSALPEGVEPQRLD
ncbi:MAG: helicase C-terminal domain-containing protein, partial [Planctomycetota bacterium]